MKEDICNYIITQAQAIPQDVYIISLIIFCAGIFIFCGVKGVKDGFRYSMALLFVEYVVLLMCSTVIYRNTYQKRNYDFTPILEYKTDIGEKDPLLPENIMNVVVFVPIGLISAAALRKYRFLLATIIGCAISVIIEAMQFYFRKGISEVDDVFCNTLGCIFGVSLYLLFIKVYKLCHC